MDNILKPISANKGLEPGTIIRRIGSEKDQQGSFLKFDENNDMILANIIDMRTGTLLASEAVLKPQASDKIYYCPSSFNDSPVSEKALKIVKDWPLYKKHADLQDKIINFVRISYIPEEIMDMSRNDSLHLLFVPLQQKFRIGRFTEFRKPERICNDNFMLWLESINSGKHITYLANIMQRKNHIPRFYSAGTKSHEETAKILRNEIYKFDPTHAGTIRATGIEKGKMHFTVDTVSKYLGLGTSPEITKTATDTLNKLYSEFIFSPR